MPEKDDHWLEGLGGPEGLEGGGQGGSGQWEPMKPAIQTLIGGH